MANVNDRKLNQDQDVAGNLYEELLKKLPPVTQDSDYERVDFTTVLKSIFEKKQTPED